MDLQQTNINRLHRLVSMISQRATWSAIPDKTAIEIGDYLQKVEGLLAVRESDQDRVMKGRECPRSEAEAIVKATEPKHPLWHVELQDVSENLEILNKDLRQRRDECRHIYGLFASRCESLHREVKGLRRETRALRSVAMKSEAEFEGLRGTVRGLERWFIEWQEQYQNVASGTLISYFQQPGSVHNDATKMTALNQGTSALVDGISAWLRGWKDVDETFTARAIV